MRAVIPVLSDDEKACIGPRFARSPYFVIADKDMQAYKIIRNPLPVHEPAIGKKIVEHLIREEGIDTIIALEMGLFVQQTAGSGGIRLVILSDEKHYLEKILHLMDIKKKINH